MVRSVISFSHSEVFFPWLTSLLEWLGVGHTVDNVRASL